MEMKIHLIPTDKPSRLTKQGDDLEKIWLYTRPIDFRANEIYPQHIYITDNSEIRNMDWVIQVNFEKTNTQLIHCVTDAQVKIANDRNGSFTKSKIILTTNKLLIKDGVQAIDDEFLEWFVKNPSCERKMKDNFQELFDYCSNELGATPLLTQMHEIIKIATRMNRRSTERKDRNGVEIFEGDYLVDRYEEGESLFKVVYSPELMAWAIDTSYTKNGSQMVSIHEFFGNCLEVKGNTHEGS